MHKATFNFHDLVGVELYTEDAVAQDFFQEEYAYARGDGPPGMKVVRLHWYRGRYPAGHDLRLIPHSHKALARWKYAITVDDEMIDIVAAGNQFAIPMVHHMMVHPSLRYLVSMNDTIMLHGASVATDTQSFVFSGPGGMGKTTLSSLMLAERRDVWKLHADDYVFIHSKGQTFAYLTRSHLYRDLLQWLPEMRARLTAPEIVRIEMLGRIRELSKENIKWPVRIGADRLWPDYDVSQKADLGGLCILSRGVGQEPELSEIIPQSTDIDELLDMNFFEARHFLVLLSKALGASRVESILESWRKREEKVLIKLKKTGSFYSLELPGLTTHKKGMGDHVTNILLAREP